MRADVEALENEAIEAVKQLMEALPASPDPLALMGMVQVRFGDIAEGMAWWQRCLDADPKRVDVLDGMAQIAAEKGDLDKAAQLWSRITIFHRIIRYPVERISLEPLQPTSAE